MGSTPADSYPHLRNVLALPLARMPAETIDSLFTGPGASAQQLENFLGSLQNIGRQVVSALPQVLPAVLPVVGSVVGGPVGGALGSLAGQAIGQALTAPAPSAPPAPPAAPAAPSVGTAPVGIAPVGAPPAAAQLLQTLFRPETLQALVAMLLGPAGRPSLAVAGTSAPVAAFANAIEVLAADALVEYSASGAGRRGSPAYLEDYAGESLVDGAVPEQRAARLLELFDLADHDRLPIAPARRRPRRAEAINDAAAEDDGAVDDSVVYDYYEELELAELEAGA